MSIVEQVLSQAKYMAEEVTAEKEGLLQTICQAVVATLAARLRDELTPEDCLSDFVTAAGMYAVALMAQTGDLGGVEQITAGDLTLRRGDNRAADQLRMQADLLMAPYLKTNITFLGV